MDTEDFMRYFLNSLLNEYLPLTVLLEDEVEETTTWDRLQAKVLNYAEKLAPVPEEIKHIESERSPAVTFNTRFYSNCHKCNKYG